MLVEQLTPDVLLRSVEESDVDGLVRAYTRNRDHLAPWDPRRNADFYTRRFHLDLVRRQLLDIDAGRAARFLLIEADEVVGQVQLSNVAHGPFKSADLGYWVDAAHTGAGLATAAVRAVCGFADRELSLHRLQASTLLHNIGSQRVLGKCGFEAIGVAPRYLYIGGEWQDQRLFQKILNDRPAN